MSFILDALKKSESDRQRQNGPALFEVRVAPPRTRLPLWAIAIALLLVVNLGIVMWMLMRHQAHGGNADVSTAAVAGGTSASAAAGTPAPAAAAGASVPAPNPSIAGTSAQLPTVAASAPASSGTAPAPPTGAPLAGAPLAGTASGAVSAPPAASPAATPAAGASAEEMNPADYAPAAEGPSGPGLGSHVRRGTASGVPLYQDLTTTPGTQLPQLRLDLHVFAGRAEDRFVMINMHKVREGDTLPEGVHVDSITPEGAVLSFNGTKFLLPRD